MSSTEAVTILGVISSIISIVDGIKQVYDAASNTKGLPEAFREVATRLPIIQDILGLARRHVNQGNADMNAFEGVMDVVEHCEKKAQKLQELFQRVLPVDDASRTKRYISAVRTLGKGVRVETLMKGMLEDVRLLGINHGIAIKNNTQWKALDKAIKEMAALPPSLLSHTIEEGDFVATHSGSGAVNQVQGTQFNNPGSGHLYHAQTITFGFNDPRKDEAQACLTALFKTLQLDPRDHRSKLVQQKGMRTKGTCEWIKSNELYKAWLRAQSNLLWLSGGPGKGKTMFSIFFAQELEKITRQSQNALFLEYFCDIKDKRRNAANSIIRGLVFQLLQLRPSLFDHILPVFKTQRGSLFTVSSMESLWRIFENMICDPLLGTIYCVLDGLDECDELSLGLLLRHFKALFAPTSNNSPSCHLNLILVSRDLPDLIPEILSGFPHICLDSNADNEVNQDVNRFIDIEMDDISSHKRYPQRLKVKVKSILRDRAQGTFLWVGIVISTLRKYKATEVEKVLELFPAGLEEIYGRMLLQINVNRRGIAAQMLRGVTMADCPLTLSELGAAIEPTVEPSATCSLDEIIRDHVSYCGHFLTIKECKVSLIHQSAKDYLLRKSRDSNPELEAFRVKEKAASPELARKCLDYLHNGSFADGRLNPLEDTMHLENLPIVVICCILLACACKIPTSFG